MVPETPAPAASRAPLIAAIAVGLLLATPVLVLRYPPMGDLAFHESLVALLRHWGDAAWEPPGIYALNLGVPNQLFHFCAWALSFVMPTDMACKVVVAVAVLAIPLAGLRLARHFDASPWAALLPAPLALGFAFRWGLVGNVVALPLLLAALPGLDAAAAEPSNRNVARAWGLVLLLYLAHESALVVGVAAAVLFALYPVRPDDVPGALKRASPVVLGAGLALYYAVRSRHLKAPSILAVPDAYGENPVARVLDVPKVVFGNLETWMLALVFGLFAVSFVPLGIARYRATQANRRAASHQASPASWLDVLHRHRLCALAATCFAAYLGMPVAFGGSTVLYQRFLPMGLALLAVAIAPLREWRPPLLALVLPPCVAFAMLFVTLPAFGDADRRFRELDAVLPLIDHDSAVAQIDLTPSRNGLVAPIPGAPARALAERGGRLLFSFTDAPTSPVVMTAEHQWNEPVLRLVQDPYAFSPPHDLGRFRYVVVRVAPAWHALSPLVARVMAPEATLVKDAGEWLLFESQLPVAPLTAPDETLATAPEDTLRSRLAARRSPRAEDTK
jgi:hypothetical protein